MRRLTALLLAVSLCFSLMEIVASAAGGSEIPDASEIIESQITQPEETVPPQPSPMTEEVHETVQDPSLTVGEPAIILELPTPEEDSFTVSGLSVEPAEQTVRAGSSVYFTAVAYPENTSLPNLIWSSSDPSVAVAAGGFVTGTGTGAAVITAAAADGSVSGSALVYVNRYSVTAPWLTSAEYVFRGTDYRFTPPETVGTVSVTVDSVPVEVLFSEGTYTVRGADVTGNIVIACSRFAVTLPEGFTGAAYAEAGQRYTFSADDAKNDYTVSAVMGGNAVEVRQNAETKEYCIENVTGELVISAVGKNAVFSVTAQGSGGGEEAFIELNSDKVRFGRDYTFQVRHGGRTLEELSVTVTVGGKTYSLGDSADRNVLKLTASGDYWTVTVPASAIVGDILITALCRGKDKYTVTFEDSYYAASRYLKYRFTAFKIVLVTENNGAVTRTLLDDHIDPAARNIRIELPSHERLCFEVVLPKENSFGKYYTDPNTDCCIYDFTGSTMDGTAIGNREFKQDTYIYTLPSSAGTDTDGTCHVDYYLDDVCGDVTIRLKPIMAKFSVSVNGTGAAEISLGKTTASYRSNLAFGKIESTMLDSITVGGKKISLNAGYRYAVDSRGQQNTNSFIIDGTYITGDIVINATKTTPDEVPVAAGSTTSVSSAGSEYALSISEFRHLKDGKCIYLIKARGESADFMQPCFDGHEMLCFDPYGAYVYLTVSDEKSDEFCEKADERFDELSEEDIQYLQLERLYSRASTEKEERAITDAVTYYILGGDLNGDYTVDEEDVSLARELYMNTEPEEKTASLGLCLLADINRSGVLDMRDIAGIKRIAEENAKAEKEKAEKEKADREKSSGDEKKTDVEIEKDDDKKERSYRLELCVDGTNSVTAETGEEITAEWKLVRTDSDPDGDAAVSVIQDEIYFDGELLALLEEAELADGVEMTTFEVAEDGQEEKVMQCLNLSYLESEDSVKPEKETVLGVFRFKVTGEDANTVLSHDNAFVISSDNRTEHPCELTELTVEILPPGIDNSE